MADGTREIEHKFLVRVERLPDAARTGGARLTQGYLSFVPSVRVRVSETIEIGGGAGGPETKAWLTIKGPGVIERAEYEYEIPTAHAREMLGLCAATLTKTRRRVPVGAHTWDVDEFTGSHAGLWLAEVEISAQGEDFERPPWLGEEVSKDGRYANGALARAGRAP